MSDNKNCTVCPRRCGADRKVSRGMCGADSKVRVARVGLHMWEEPCISYGKGSGTVFFSGCSLGCVYCQNYEISCLLKGRDIEPGALSSLFLKVRDMGAANLNLVNPTHYSEDIVSALKEIKGELGIPVVYNTGGYDRAETLRKFSGLVDIYLPDVKYYSGELSEKYSGAADYFEVCIEALTEMFRQTGYSEFSEDGHMKKGVLIRHLVLPGMYRDSFKILEELSERFDTEKLYVSIMRQYFPSHRAKEFPELSRKLTTLEYEKVLDYAEKLGIKNGFSQSRESATKEYVPSFDF